MNSSPRSSSIWRNNAGVAALVAGLALGLCTSCSDSTDWVQQRRHAMGTWVDTIYPRLNAQAERRLQDELDGALQRYEIDYYAWADGELGRLNAALAERESFAVSVELADLLADARTISARSEGYFDPGVGELVEAWGFHRGGAVHKEPEPEFLQRWADDPAGIADLRIHGNRIDASRALIIDLGGIAKGEVVDRLLDLFVAAGVHNVLVDAGGDVRVLGTRGERSWTIGIQSPRDPQGLLGSIPLHDGEAAFTSGDYERFFESESGRRHHLLDPRSGVPAAHTQAVTVIAGNGALADAAATAIFVAGPENWRRVAASLGVACVLRVDASGTIEMTAPMRERISMQADDEPATMQ